MNAAMPTNTKKRTGLNCVAIRGLLQKNLHVLKIKGHRIRLDEIVTDHAGAMKAKPIFPRERSIVKKPIGGIDFCVAHHKRLLARRSPASAGRRRLRCMRGCYLPR